MSISKLLGIQPAKIDGADIGTIARILGVENAMGWDGIVPLEIPELPETGVVTSVISETPVSIGTPGETALSLPAYSVSAYVAPEGWSGTVITAGAGKEYANLYQAWAAAADGDLILVYGNHDLTNQCVTLPNKKLFVRGMGNTPEDTVISAMDDGVVTALIYLASGSSGIFENLKLFYNYAWDNAGVIRLAGVQDVIFNKCHIYYSSLGLIHDVFKTAAAAQITGSVIFRQSKLTRGSSHFRYLDLSVISMQKTEINGALKTNYCEGSFAESDYVTAPADNYGYAYGDYLISGEFLAAFGY
jgi:hypothetical protein